MGIIDLNNIPIFGEAPKAPSFPVEKSPEINERGLELDIARDIVLAATGGPTNESD